MDEVDTYISQFEEPVQERLNQLRLLTKQLVPEAIEAISYGLIGYKYRGKPLVYYGGFAHHIGFYATPNGHEAFKKEFQPYKQGKGSVQLPHNQELPVELIRRVIVFRVESIEQ